MNIQEFKKQVTNRGEALDFLCFLAEAFKYVPSSSIDQRIGCGAFAQRLLEAKENRNNIVLRPRRGKTITQASMEDAKGVERIENKECGACTGWWIAYWLDLRDDTFPHIHHAYTDGVEALNHTLSLLGAKPKEQTNGNTTFRHKIPELLVKYGASKLPYTHLPWPKHPKVVFKAVADELKGRGAEV